MYSSSRRDSLGAFAVALTRDAAAEGGIGTTRPPVLHGDRLRARIASRLAARKAMGNMVGRALAGQALARLGATGAVGRDSHGAPVWPRGMQGSISHSHGMVGVWLGQGATTFGLDLEALADPRAVRAICHSVLTPGDRVHLGATPDAAGATAVFSAKEALYKALFPRVGRFFGFDHAEIAEIRPDGLALRLTKPLSTGWPAGCVFEIAQHWRAGTVISQCEIAS